MAGKLSFTLTIDGTDKAAQGLKSVTNAIQGVGPELRKLLSGFARPELDAFLKKNKDIRDVLASEYSNAKKAGLAFASMGTGEFPINKHAEKFGANLKQARQGMAELRVANKAMVRGMMADIRAFDWGNIHTSAGNKSPFLAAFINQSLGIGAGTYSGGKGYANWWKTATPSSLIPPISSAFQSQGMKSILGMGPLNPLIPPIGMSASAQGARQVAGMGPLTPNAPDFKMAIAGMISSAFSPWIGARALNSSGVTAPLHKMLGIGESSGGGGLFGKLMGAGGFGGFMVDFVALNAVVRGTRFAFDELIGAVKKGSDLYLKAAMLGTGLRNYAGVSKAFEALGLPSNTAEKLMASGQFSRGKKMTVENMIAGAGGVLNQEDIQAITNFRKELKFLVGELNSSSRQAASSARSLYDIKLWWSLIVNEWNTMWQQLVSALSPVILLVEQMTQMSLKLVNLLIEINSWLSIIPLLGRGRDRQFERFGGASQASHINSWQRMGFVMNGFGTRPDYGREIAHNTAIMVNLLTRYGYGTMPTPVANNGASTEMPFDSRYNRP